MQSFVRFRHIAEQCARMRDGAGSERARARLERERLDWLGLAQEAGLARRAVETRSRLDKMAILRPPRAA